ncbi:MAG TPA: DEAD/DEAH box helicase [Bacteroidaceae bacterium]|nr:DEAD/DEAH box helicase [Bacteroidaceae bacterium]
MKNFEELGVSTSILQAIDELGYVSPTPVQEKVIPYLLGEGYDDVVALAQTGTGKTAAFGLPIIQMIDVKKQVPQSLVLCPTRELCLQISADLTDYSKYIPHLKVLPVYGGSSIGSQIKALKKGVHIIVATPGRLIDLMERNVVSLQTIQNVIMDEADEMLNMGFTDSINAILADVPQERNTLLFSATMSPEIARIAKQYLNDPKEITIGSKNESTNTVEHVAYTVHAKDKYAALKRVADLNPQIYGIVFCRTRQETQDIADKLIQDGYNADSLHGDLSQAQRDAVMQKFRSKHLQMLVATDIAGRGIDVNNLTHVINYGLPDDIESYTHRSGRTGRAGRKGTSICIINMREKGKLKAIERIIKKQFVMGDLPTGQQICEQQLVKLIDDVEKVQVNEEEIEKFMPDVYRKLEWLSREDIIKRMVSLEFNRFLDYYRDQEELESPQDVRERRTRDGNKTEGFTRLFINLGKLDKFFPRELMSLINNNTKKRVELGDIAIMKSFSFFEVEDSMVEHLLEVMQRARYNGRAITVQVAQEDKGDLRDKRSGRKSGGGKFSGKGGRSAYGGDSRNNRQDAPRRDKPSREERGYAQKRGKREDWKQFFEPGFDPNSTDHEEGFARRKPKKK